MNSDSFCRELKCYSPSERDGLERWSQDTISQARICGAVMSAILLEISFIRTLETIVESTHVFIVVFTFEWAVNTMSTVCKKYCTVQGSLLLYLASNPIPPASNHRCQHHVHLSRDVSSDQLQL